MDIMTIIYIGIFLIAVYYLMPYILVFGGMACLAIMAGYYSLKEKILSMFNKNNDEVKRLS